MLTGVCDVIAARACLCTFAMTASRRLLLLLTSHSEWCLVQYLYTLCVKDAEKARKLRQSLPPGEWECVVSA
jgi:hypothetical protein